MDGMRLTLVALAVGLLAAGASGNKDVIVGYLWLVTIVLLAMALYVAVGG